MAILLILSINIYGANYAPKITSKAGIVMDVKSGRILFEKNIRGKLKIASLTKIMTSIVALENCSLADGVVISKKASGVGGSTVGLKAGTTVKLEALMYGLLLESGNDCAIAIAEHVGGTVEEFVNMMNKKAFEIGAKDTNFTNPHGLDTENNYCTAYDLALITKYAIGNSYINNIIVTRNITLNFSSVSKYLSNTNRLLGSYSYCDGGKTGFTNIANRCLIATATKNDMRVISIILGAETTNIRFNEAKNILDYALSNYTIKDISKYMKWYIEVPVYKGNIFKYTKRLEEKMEVPLKENEIEEIYVKQSIVPIINAPAKRGMMLGTVEMYIDNEKIYNKDIILDVDIKKNGVIDYMKRQVKEMFNIEFVFR